MWSPPVYDIYMAVYQLMTSVVDMILLRDDPEYQEWQQPGPYVPQEPVQVSFVVVLNATEVNLFV